MVTDENILRIIQTNPWITRAGILKKLNLRALSNMNRALIRIDEQYGLHRRHQKQTQYVNKIHRLVEGLPPVKTVFYAYQYKAKGGNEIGD